MHDRVGDGVDARRCRTASAVSSPLRCRKRTRTPTAPTLAGVSLAANVARQLRGRRADASDRDAVASRPMSCTPRREEDRGRGGSGERQPSDARVADGAPRLRHLPDLGEDRGRRAHRAPRTTSRVCHPTCVGDGSSSATAPVSGSGANQPSVSALLGQAAGDDAQAERLVGAFEDRQHPRVDEVARHRELLGVAHAAVQLHRLARDPLGGAAHVGLHHRSPRACPRRVAILRATS